MKERLIVAIDGTAGAGKSTLAKALAEQLNYLYVDTGAMYRAFTWKVLQHGTPLDHHQAIDDLAADSVIEIMRDGDTTRVVIDGEDVTEKIRTPVVSDSVSIVSKLKGVRQHMIAQQQRIGAQGGVVLEGRDIGTVVFPDADIKFFIDASLKERARRRYEELCSMDINTTLEQVEESMEERDMLDTTRDLSPLKPAHDAVIIDSTDLSVDEKTEKVMEFVKERLDARRQ